MKKEFWYITAVSRLTGKREPITPKLSAEMAAKVFAMKYPNGRTRRGAAWMNPKIEHVQPTQLELQFEP